MPTIDSMIMPGERILYRARYHPGPLYSRSVLLWIALAIYFAGTSSFDMEAGWEFTAVEEVFFEDFDRLQSVNDFRWFFRWVTAITAIVVALAGLWYFLPSALKHLSESMVVTNRRIITRRGILGSQVTEHYLSQLNSVQIAQSLLERMFGSGRLIVHTSSGALTLTSGLADPARLRRFIAQAMDELHS